MPGSSIELPGSGKIAVSSSNPASQHAIVCPDPRVTAGTAGRGVAPTGSAAGLQMGSTTPTGGVRLLVVVFAVHAADRAWPWLSAGFGFRQGLQGADVGLHEDHLPSLA